MGLFDMFVPEAFNRMEKSYSDLNDYYQGRISESELKARADLRNRGPKGPLDTLIDLVEGKK